MRLLRYNNHDDYEFSKDLIDSIPSYAILSHTWLIDEQELTYKDIIDGTGRDKAGYEKIRFCAEQAKKDGLEYFWVDTCCIDKTNSVELSEAITSMFRWYRDSHKCYVYLSDVSSNSSTTLHQAAPAWESQFRASKWFRRGWTLQELLAPPVVEFYSIEKASLGNKSKLVDLIHEITDIPVKALIGTLPSEFPIEERMRWAATRQTKKAEDKAYSLQGLFGVFIPVLYGEGEHAFVRVREAILKRHGSATESTHKYWIVSRQPHPLFTGREALLHEIESNIRKSLFNCHPTTSGRIVISGIGGQGKSETALQVASRLRYMFWAVMWIDMSTSDLAERSFLRVAQSLSLPAQTSEEALLSLANLKQPWLLVLDNADDLDIDYSVYFPVSVNGIVLMTTRNVECHQYATLQAVQLECLNLEDACCLLLRACGIPEDGFSIHEAQTREVANLLQSHALVIIQAGAYIARGHCTLAAYTEVYQQQRKRLLSFRPKQARSRYGDVYATFEVSVGALHNMEIQSARDALKLLHILAMFGTNSIPIACICKWAWEGANEILKKTEQSLAFDQVQYLTRWQVAKMPSFIESSFDNYRSMEAIYLLKALSLISVSEVNESPCVSFHPLVHAWARDRQSGSELHLSWLEAGCLISLGLWVLSAFQKHMIEPCVETLVDWPSQVMFVNEEPVHVLQILFKCGNFLHEADAVYKLDDLLQRTFQHLHLDPREIDTRYIDFYQLAGVIAARTGKASEALHLLRQVVKTKRLSLPEDHRDRLESEVQLAWILHWTNQDAEAISLLEKVIEIKKSWGETDSSRLDSEHSLAMFYQSNHRFDEAAHLLENIVRIEKEVYIEEHPIRLQSETTLAELYRIRGQVKEAIAIMERVYPLQAQTLGDDHRHTIGSLVMLASLYESDGQTVKAMTYFEQELEIRNRQVPKHDGEILKTQNLLGQLYRHIGELDKSRHILEKVVAFQATLLPKENSELLTMQVNLGRTYLKSGQLEKAWALAKLVMEIREANFPESDGGRLRAGRLFANCLWQRGERTRAIKELREVVRCCQQQYKEDNELRRAVEGDLSEYEAEIEKSISLPLWPTLSSVDAATIGDDHETALREGEMFKT